MKPLKVLAALGVVFFGVAASPAVAQVTSAEQQVLLDRMKAAPTDHDNTFAYVRVLTEARDYEAAIAALERILQYNPGLTRAKYELGVLYYRLRSYPKAVLHFEDAATDTNLDPAIRRRLEGFVSQARKELQASRFYGVFQAGLRYNSNLSGTPGSAAALSFPVPNFFDLKRRADTSAFVLGDVSHVYDFQNQRGDTWESRFAGYANRPFRATDLSLGLFDMSTGPRLALAPDWLPGLTFRPYVSGGASMIDGNGYSSNFGGGVSLRTPITAFFALEWGLDGRKVDVTRLGFFRSRDIISTGSLWTGSIAANWSITDSVTFNGKALFRRNKAEGNGIDSNHTGLEASLKFEFDPPSEAIGMRWSATPYIRYTNVAFQQTEILSTGPVRRRDTQLRAGLQLDTPLTPHLGFSSSIEYTQNRSNIIIYSSSGWSIMTGPTLRF